MDDTTSWMLDWELLSYPYDYRSILQACNYYFYGNVEKIKKFFNWYYYEEQQELIEEFQISKSTLDDIMRLLNRCKKNDPVSFAMECGTPIALRYSEPDVFYYIFVEKIQKYIDEYDKQRKLVL